MSERPEGADGLGRSSGGTPDFVQPAPPTAPVAPSPPLPPRPAVAPPAPHRAGLVTAAVVLVVVAVTALGSFLAWRADSQLAPPPPVATRPPMSSATPDRDTILFTGAHGTGRLAVREHSWEPGRPDRLRLVVELTCTTGTVDHGPDSFQLFDSAGTLVEASPAGGGPGSLGHGRLSRGEQVRGEVLFDVPRQVVTLVLTDDAGAVAALRITD